MKGLKIVIAVVVIILAAGGGWWFFRGADRQKPSAQATETPTATVTRGAIKMTVAGEGSIEAGYREQIKAEAQGTIQRLSLKEGQIVAAGDSVALLVDELASEANETMKLQVEKMQMDLQQRRQELEDLRSDLQGLSITAPSSGTIAELQLQEGQSIGKNGLVAKIIQPALLEVVVPFNKVQIQKIAVGQEASILLLDYYKEVAGHVTKVDNRGRGTSGGGMLYDVTLQLENPGALQTGQAVQAAVLSGSERLPAVEEGTLRQVEGETVRSQVSGTVKTLAVEEGQVVKAGDVLALLDSRDLDNQIASKELQIKQQELDLDNKNFKDVETNVISPVAGTVTTVDVTEGEEIKAGVTLAEIVDYSGLSVVIPVDEMDIAKVQPGQQVSITATALPGKTFLGRVTEIAQEGKSQGGVATFDVKVGIDDPGELKVGMTAQVEIVVAASEDTLLLPVTAVQQRGGSWTVSLPSDNGTPNWQPVEVGLADERQIEIVSGLQEGQQVLLPNWSNPADNSQAAPRGNGGNMNFGGGMANPLRGGSGMTAPLGGGGGQTRAIQVPSRGGS